MVSRSAITRGRGHPQSVATGRVSVFDGRTVSSAAHFREIYAKFLTSRADELTVVDENGDGLGTLRPDDMQAAGARCLPLDIATARDALAGGRADPPSGASRG